MRGARLNRSHDNTDTARLFFALWPDEAARRTLAELARALRRECGGRMVRSSNIHLTLAFLGDVPVARITDLVTAVRAIGGSPFELAIDTHGYWRHNRIVWAGPVHCPGPLRDLVACLVQALQAMGFQCDAREYAPHITLLRGARRAPQSHSAGTIAWPATELTLARSARRDGALVYEIVNRCSLVCRPSDPHNTDGIICGR